MTKVYVEEGDDVALPSRSAPSAAPATPPERTSTSGCTATARQWTRWRTCAAVSVPCLHSSYSMMTFSSYGNG
jgi:hypothetical protein